MSRYQCTSHQSNDAPVQQAEGQHDHAHGHSHAHGAHWHGGAGHSHGVDADADGRYLTIAFVLIVAFMTIEVVIGIVAHSLALLSDAGTC